MQNITTRRNCECCNGVLFRFLLLSLCPGRQNVEIRAAGIRKTRLERARTPENGDGAQHFKANTGQRINP